MPQKYEIFYGEKRFIVSGNSTQDFDDFIVFPIEAAEFESFNDYLELLTEHPQKKGVVFMSEEPGPMLERLLREFNEIKAAGGMVSNPSGELLLIKRKGRWDLPKGKIEQGEFMRQAALREVREECGVQKLKIVATVKPTFHLYNDNNELMLKTTYWYSMDCLDPENIKGQQEEGIEEVKWVDQDELKPYIEDTYPNIKLLLALFSSQKKNYDDLA